MNLAQLNFGPAANRGAPYHVDYNGVPLYSSYMTPAEQKAFDKAKAAYEKALEVTDDAPAQVAPEAPSPPKKPVIIHLLGIDSDAYTVAENANRDAVIEEQRKKEPFRSAVHDDRATRLLVACTSGWENVPRSWYDDSGSDEPIPFSPEAAYVIYSKAGLSWLRNKVDAEIGDRDRFLTA